MADEPPYLCWEEHQEDLTAKVMGERNNPGQLTLYYRRRGEAEKRVKVFVTCSEEHLNVFEPAAPESG